MPPRVRPQAHPCLTADEILGHFGQRRATAQEKYRDFVQDGIGGRSIWEELEAQSLLGVEGFAVGLRHLVTDKQQIREVPKGQRCAGRPTLEKLFAQRTADKTTRDQLIEEAVNEFGYSQMELASFLDLHYSTITEYLLNDSDSKSKDLTPRVRLWLLWTFAGGGSLFVYQSAVYLVGYSFGYFAGRDFIKIGAVFTIVQGVLLLLVVLLYWPWIGLNLTK